MVFPLHGRLTGRRYWAEYRRLRALQWESLDALEARSLAKLRTLVERVNADDQLKPVFNGKSQVSMFEMTKLVSKHLR